MAQAAQWCHWCVETEARAVRAGFDLKEFWRDVASKAGHDAISVEDAVERVLKSKVEKRKASCGT